MKGYKAFEPGLICKGKQYEENAIATEERAEPCKCGIHFCESPFDVLDYYPLITDEGKFTDFAEVEALDEPVTDDKKRQLDNSCGVETRRNQRKICTNLC